MADITPIVNLAKLRELEAANAKLREEIRALTEERNMTRGLHELVRLQMLDILQICKRQRAEMQAVEDNIERLRQRLPE
jgi:hypothetical protein